MSQRANILSLVRSFRNFKAFQKNANLRLATKTQIRLIRSRWKLKKKFFPFYFSCRFFFFLRLSDLRAILWSAAPAVRDPTRYKSSFDLSRDFSCVAASLTFVEWEVCVFSCRERIESGSTALLEFRKGTIFYRLSSLAAWNLTLFFIYGKRPFLRLSKVNRAYFNGGRPFAVERAGRSLFKRNHRWLFEDNIFPRYIRWLFGDSISSRIVSRNRRDQLTECFQLHSVLKRKLAGSIFASELGTGRE